MSLHKVRRMNRLSASRPHTASAKSPQWRHVSSASSGSLMASTALATSTQPQIPVPARTICCRATSASVTANLHRLVLQPPHAVMRVSRASKSIVALSLSTLSLLLCLQILQRRLGHPRNPLYHTGQCQHWQRPRSLTTTQWSCVSLERLVSE